MEKQPRIHWWVGEKLGRRSLLKLMSDWTCFSFKVGAAKRVMQHLDTLFTCVFAGPSLLGTAGGERNLSWDVGKKQAVHGSRFRGEWELAGGRWGVLAPGPCLGSGSTWAGPVFSHRAWSSSCSIVSSFPAFLLHLLLLGW